MTKYLRRFTDEQLRRNRSDRMKGSRNPNYIDMTNRSCSLCGSSTSRILKSGRLLWQYGNNKQLLCSRCYDKQRKPRKYPSKEALREALRIHTTLHNPMQNPEYRKKISIALSGPNHPQYGKPKPEAIRRQISQTMKGRTISAEHKANIRKGRSRVISKKETQIEIIMCKLLTDANISFKRNVPFKLSNGTYHQVDFLVGESLVVEVDGEFWHTLILRRNGRFLKDYFIDVELESLGLTVRRFWSTDIKRQPNWCLNQITNTLKSIHRINTFSHPM